MLTLKRGRKGAGEKSPASFSAALNLAHRWRRDQPDPRDFAGVMTRQLRSRLPAFSLYQPPCRVKGFQCCALPTPRPTWRARP